MTRCGAAATVAVLAGLVLRLAAVQFFEARTAPGERFYFGDSESYWELGRSIAERRPYEFGPDRARVFRTPGYPLALAALQRLGGPAAEPIAAAYLSAILGAATIAATFLLARRLFDDRTAAAAAWLVALSPDCIAISAVALSEAPFTVLFLAQWIVWFGRDRERPGAARSAAVGLLAAAAILVRPSWLLFWPGVTGGVLASAIVWRSTRAWIAPTAIAAAASLAVLSPWWVRNYLVVDRFVPTTLQVGASLYDGLRPDADGASDMRFVDEFRAQARAAESPSGPHPPFEVRLDQALRDAALAWAGEHPGRVLQLAGVKAVRMWNVRPNEPSLRGKLIDAGMISFTLPAFLLAAVGAWRLRQRAALLAWLLGPAAYFTALHMIFVAGVRYRAPVMPVVLILTAAGAVYLALGILRREEAPRPTAQG